MKQHINLYTDDFKPKKVVLSLVQILSLSVVLIGILVLASMALTADLKADRAMVAETEHKAESMAKRVAAMEEEVSQRVLDESLVEANKRLKEKVRAREQMIQALKSLVIEDSGSKFSSILLGLARQQSQDLWLKRIHVGLSGHAMTLQGSMLAAEAVPEYLQRLRNEPAFVGRSFSLFELEADERTARTLHFELQSNVLFGPDDAGSQQLGASGLELGGLQ